MKIYAIKDRLIDYFMAPFAAPGDKEVLAALATRVNQQLDGQTNDAIIQAPHHFEIWRLGEVNEGGHLSANREFIADCSSLIRGGIRRAEARTADRDGLEGPKNEGSRQPGGDGGDPATRGAAPSN